MHARGHRLAVAITTALLIAAPVSLSLEAGAWAQDATTTTTTAATTTTTAATTTTTTTPATTTTSASTTTTTHPHATTTTTEHPTTTSTAAPSSKSSSSTPWGWILLAVVLVLAAILVAALIARSKRQGRAVDWQRSVRPAVAAAELARDLVLSQTESDDPQRRASVGVQVDEAVDGLERCADSAPDDIARGMSTRAAEGLRGLAFAVEADHLMRSGGQHPTGDQLASADAAKRNRAAELESALLELKAAVTPPPAGTR
jgi:hypothetical protein